MSVIPMELQTRDNRIWIRLNDGGTNAVTIQIIKLPGGQVDLGITGMTRVALGSNIPTMTMEDFYRNELRVN